MRRLVLVLAFVTACRDVTAPEVTGCEFWQSAPQVIPNTSTETTVVFDAGTCESQTLPVGRWLVLAKVTFAVDSTGLRGASIQVNGVNVDDAGASPFPKGPYVGVPLTAVVTSDGTARVSVTASVRANAPVATVPAFDGLHLTRLSFSRL